MRYLKTDRKRMSEERGLLTGSDYKAFVRETEFNSTGTCVLAKDWQSGRAVHLMSQGELYFWNLLKFDPDVVEVREQVVLDLDLTLQLAKEYGIKHPYSKMHHMTTNFFVLYKDERAVAYSIKDNKKRIKDKRTAEILFLEKKYWERKNVLYEIRFKEDMDVIKAENIRICSYYWDPKTVVDEVSCLKHMIIHHEIELDQLDLCKEILKCGLLVNEYKSEIQRKLRLLEGERIYAK